MEKREKKADQRKSREAKKQTNREVQKQGKAEKQETKETNINKKGKNKLREKRALLYT